MMRESFINALLLMEQRNLNAVICQRSQGTRRWENQASSTTARYHQHQQRFNNGGRYSPSFATAESPRRLHQPVGFSEYIFGASFHQPLMSSWLMADGHEFSPVSSSWLPFLLIMAHVLLGSALRCEAVTEPQSSLPQPGGHQQIVAAPQDTKRNHQVLSWELMNGAVSLSNPTTFKTTTKKGDNALILSDPELLGSGGGGAVFAMSRAGRHLPRVALKVSWSKSTASVLNECHVLQIMEQYHVPHVEQCLAMEPYDAVVDPDGATAGTQQQQQQDSSSSSPPSRIMIAMTPVMEGMTVSRIRDLPTQPARQYAVRSLVETMVRMLAANVVTTDVQPLFSLNDHDHPNNLSAPRVLLIDMTEAKVLSSSAAASFSGGSSNNNINSNDDDSTTRTTLSIVDRALASSFVSEILSLIPDEELSTVPALVQRELDLLDGGVSDNKERMAMAMRPELREILLDQVG